MLQVFMFNELGVVVRHWYEVVGDDEEHGTRVELRRRIPVAHRGTESAAQLLQLDELLWRADLFDLIGPAPGNMLRAHHHAHCLDNEPEDREWDDLLSSDPFGWTERRLGGLEQLLAEIGVTVDDLEGEAADLRRALPSIMEVARANAGAECRSPQSCRDATRDTREIVAMMTMMFRGDTVDPRLGAIAAEA
jgi:hypothetical protein